MNQLDNYLSYGVMIFGMVFFTIFSIMYFRYWNQLREAFLRSGMKWPPHSQEEINEKAKTDLDTSYKMISTNMVAAARIIFTMKTDNPIIQKPLRSIRRTLLAFIIIPIVFTVILAFVIALIEVSGGK